MAEHTSAYNLWRQAGGGTDRYSRDEYRRLMIEAGLLIVSDEPAPKCTDPEHGTCGHFCPTCGDGDRDV